MLLGISYLLYIKSGVGLRGHIIYFATYGAKNNGLISIENICDIENVGQKYKTEVYDVKKIIKNESHHAMQYWQKPHLTQGMMKNIFILFMYCHIFVSSCMTKFVHWSNVIKHIFEYIMLVILFYKICGINIFA